MPDFAPPIGDPETVNFTSIVFAAIRPRDDQDPYAFGFRRERRRHVGN